MDLQEEKRNKQESEFLWDGQNRLDRAWETYLKREAFAYDPDKDPLYRQYAQRYTRLGKLAMEDAVGTASALTGGYANSYAQSAGQQAYESYMQRLNDVLPELYGDAYDRYQAEGEALYDAVVLQQEQRDRAYREFLDRQSWENKLEQQAYEREQAALALQLEQEQQAYEREQAAQSASSKGSSSGSSKGSSGSAAAAGNTTYDTHGYKKADIRALQEAAGLVVDGVWGPETQKAYEAGWRREGTAGTQQVSATMLEEHQLTPHELVVYGSYRDYVAYTILSAGLTDREEDYLFRIYREKYPEFGSGWGKDTHLQSLRDRGLI